MRGGQTVATADPREVSVAELTRLIVGSTTWTSAAPSAAIGEPVLHGGGPARGRAPTGTTC